jgi:NAD(P)-dependent dehydrogenase (short-subunit alcohol dehydrogenase family)
MADYVHRGVLKGAAVAGAFAAAGRACDNRASTVPLKVGWLQPDDISPAAVFLASDAAKMVTGAEYELTGGDSAKDI